MSRRSRRLQSQQELVLAESAELIASIHAEYSNKSASEVSAESKPSKAKRSSSHKTTLSDRTNRAAKNAKTVSTDAFEFIATDNSRRSAKPKKQSSTRKKQKTKVTNSSPRRQEQTIPTTASLPLPIANDTTNKDTPQQRQERIQRSHQSASKRPMSHSPLPTPSPRGILSTTSEPRPKPNVSVTFSPDVVVGHSTPNRTMPTNISIDLSTVSEASTSQNTSTMSDLVDISAEFEAMETSLKHLSPRSKSSLRRSQTASSSSNVSLTGPSEITAASGQQSRSLAKTPRRSPLSGPSLAQPSSSQAEPRLPAPEPSEPESKRAHLSVFDPPDSQDEPVLSTSAKSRRRKASRSQPSDSSDLVAVARHRKQSSQLKAKRGKASPKVSRKSKSGRLAADQWLQEHADELQAQRQLIDDIDDFELAIA
eukprot:TRINITY_DN12540_c1_g2_i2.p1 TRINITY_DN12540_c1_g2~~TRINITY_DN12540_c1_g2_i2.p1  ORF type:complete len:424 (+),score=55.10 TRINITY_DN12540_c1_g2_i2:91-1362(+)